MHEVITSNAEDIITKFLEGRLAECSNRLEKTLLLFRENIDALF